VTIRYEHTDRLKGLYVITDENLIREENFEPAVEAALLGGANIIQYRDKSSDQKKRHSQAETLSRLCEQHQATCIINDDIQLAKAVGAHGVHLGKDDDSILKAREILGDETIIGVSCYDDISLAETAESNLADYVAFGAIFSSPTKQNAKVAGPEILSTARQQITLPVCAIGGITQDNIELVLQHGADMVAVISHVFAADDIRQSTKRLNLHFLKSAS